jgi:hypothetical protein
MVHYTVEGMRVRASEVTFIPIEFLGWDCLTIGALGWGQIQIANSNFLSIHPGCSRRRWMLEFCDVMIEFYPEIAKIGDRMARFEQVRAFWEGKEADRSTPGGTSRCCCRIALGRGPYCDRQR